MTALARKRRYLKRERRLAIALPASARGMSRDWDLLRNAEAQAAQASYHKSADYICSCMYRAKGSSRLVKGGGDRIWKGVA